MTQYIIRRLFQSALLLLILSAMFFMLISAVPGGLLSAYAENPDMTPEDLARLRAKYGLDDPVIVRYGKWLLNMARGDFGTSFTSKRPVLVEIRDRLPNTLLLSGVSLMVTLLIAIPLGILSAIKQYSLFDQIATTLTFAGQSLPVFWFGLLLIIVFHVKLGWLPGSGMATLGQPFSLTDRIRHLILPVTMLALVMAAGYMRYMRSAMLEVINQDYIRTARAKGQVERIIILKHALRNALIPLVTLVALDIPFLFSGALFTERIFAWPGMGRLYYDAAMKTDYPLLMALLMIVAALIVLSNLLADVLYAYLDPRITYS